MMNEDQSAEIAALKMQIKHLSDTQDELKVILKDQSK
jgi:hypothetical protein